MTTKFLHTADWQMGMKAGQAGEKAADVRAKRFETAERIVELARREAVQFVLIAGDLFEDHNVGDGIVQRTVRVLNRFAPIPVFVLPGNHDPWIAGGIWDRNSWQRVQPHVTLLTEKKEVVVADGIVLYPSPLRQKQSRLDPTAWIPCRSPGDTRIRIGIAHGALDFLPEGANFPIAMTRAQEAGLDYLALGDWHGFLQQGRTVYSGTIEQTSFAEKDAGNVVVVEIPSAGAEPKITKHAVGLLSWRELAPGIRDLSDVGALREAVLQSGPPATQLLRITPQIAPGTPHDVVQELRNLREELQNEVFFLDWPEETLEVADDQHVTIPEGLLAEVDEALAAILDGRIPDGPARQFANTPLEFVREARLLLHRLVREAEK